MKNAPLPLQAYEKTPSKNITQTEENEIHDQDATEEEKEEQMHKQQIKYLRISMISVLFSTSIVVILLSHILVSKSTQKVMNAKFEDSSYRLIAGFERQMNMTVYAAWYLSNVITHRFHGTVSSNGTWPNVTLRDFELHTTGLINIARAKTISFAPLIHNNTNRLSWEEYVVNNSNHLKSTPLLNSNDTNWTISDGIFQYKNGKQIYDPGYNNLSRYPYILNPIWQVNPMGPNQQKLILMNRHTGDRTRALDDMIRYKVPTLTAPLQLAQDSKTSPSSILMFPIFNSISDGTTETKFDFLKANVVGVSSVSYSWEDIFDNILHSDINGLICVLKASNGDASTFQVNGSVATYIGNGDLHDRRYDHMEISRYTDIAKVSDILSIADNIVTYSLHVYPSQAFENEYIKNTTKIVTATSVFLFFITAALFIIYDFLLYNNIKSLSLKAQSGNNIVNSLFPEGVRERMFSKSIKKKNEKNSIISNAISSFLSLGHTKSITDYKNSNNNISIVDSEPIVDEFSSVTIMFADIPGFKSWSSSHTPQDIFMLLESVFGEFDQITKKLNVFKVETIEDCYVAVCGLPEPKENHAVIMAQFALECQVRFNQVIKSLEYIHANNLQLRCGLHSGPITAGILRGEKSRFQLFGDTMNTTSRMESTGQPGKVHLSEQTAELLSKAGKSTWFIPRDELITAKGKGTLQTYWLIPNVYRKRNSTMKRFSHAARRFSIGRRLSAERNLSIKVS